MDVYAIFPKEEKEIDNRDAQTVVAWKRFSSVSRSPYTVAKFNGRCEYAGCNASYYCGVDRIYLHHGKRYATICGHAQIVAGETDIPVRLL
jgi:hypothetical protein